MDWGHVVHPRQIFHKPKYLKYTSTRSKTVQYAQSITRHGEFPQCIFRAGLKNNTSVNCKHKTPHKQSTNSPVKKLNKMNMRHSEWSRLHPWTLCCHLRHLYHEQLFPRTPSLILVWAILEALRRLLDAFRVPQSRLWWQMQLEVNNPNPILRRLKESHINWVRTTRIV